MWVSNEPIPAKIVQIYKNRSRFRGYLNPLEGTTPSRTNILAVVDNMTAKGSVFKQYREHPSWGGLFRTLEAFTIGRPIDGKLLDHLACILAGNEQAMRIGKAIVPEANYNGTKYILVQIKEAYIAYHELKDPRYILYLELLTTEHAGKLLKYSMSRKVLRKLQAHVGLRGKYEEKRIHHRELVGSYVFIKPNMKDDWVFITDWAITSTLKGRNRKLFKSRLERVPEVCEYREKNTKCHLCPKGYGKQSYRCELGTHERNYSVQECSRCKQTALVDEYGRSGHCLGCQQLLWRG